MHVNTSFVHKNPNLTVGISVSADVSTSSLVELLYKQPEDQNEGGLLIEFPRIDAVFTMAPVDLERLILRFNKLPLEERGYYLGYSKERDRHQLQLINSRIHVTTEEVEAFLEATAVLNFHYWEWRSGPPGIES